MPPKRKIYIRIRQVQTYIVLFSHNATVSWEYPRKALHTFHEIRHTLENTQDTWENTGHTCKHLRISEGEQRLNWKYLRKSLHTLECLSPVGQLSGTQCGETGSPHHCIYEYEDEYRKLWRRRMSWSGRDIPHIYTNLFYFCNLWGPPWISPIFLPLRSREKSIFIVGLRHAHLRPKILCSSVFIHFLAVSWFSNRP